jgi:hypothetical protein
MAGSYLQDGTLTRMVGDGIRGVTAKSHDLRQGHRGISRQRRAVLLAAGGRLLSRRRVLGLVVADITAALDVLRPVFDASGGTDKRSPVRADQRSCCRAKQQVRPTVLRVRRQGLEPRTRGLRGQSSPLRGTTTCDSTCFRSSSSHPADLFRPWFMDNRLDTESTEDTSGCGRFHPAKAIPCTTPATHDFAESRPLAWRCARAMLPT